MSALASLSAAANAASITWANSGTDFATGSYWVGGIAPANTTSNSTGDTGVFGSLTSTAVPKLAANRSIYAMDFQLAGGFSAVDPAITSAAGAVMKLGGGGLSASSQTSGTTIVSLSTIQPAATQTWTIFSATSRASTSTFTVNSAVDLNGQNLTVSSNRAASAGNVGVVNLAGTISGTTGTSGLTLFGRSAASAYNTINLTGSNTYSGTTSITQVNVTANSLAPDGTNSAFGRSGDIVMGSNGSSSAATLTFQNLSADGSTGRRLLVNGTSSNGYTLNNNSANYIVSFTNTNTTINNSTNKFQLGGSNSGANTFSQVLNDFSTAVPLTVTKAGTGTWVLSGPNTYSGGTRVTGGTLRADGSLNSLGNGITNVTAGAVLAGSGATGGAVVVGNGAASGGTITAGTGATSADTVGTLSTAAQTWNNDGRFVAKFKSGNGGAATANGTGSAGTNWDLLAMGDLSLSNGFGLVLTKSLAGTFSPDATPGYYRLASTGAITVVTGSATVPVGTVNAGQDLTSLFVLDTSALGIDASHFIVQSGNDATGLFVHYDGGVNAAPEPATTALLGIGTACILGVRRRRLPDD